MNLLKVNCDNQEELCEKYKIRAFPTLRMFRHHVAIKPDYHNHRTIDDMMNYIHETLDINPRTQRQNIQKEHVGCRVQGYLYLNRFVISYSV